MILTARLNNHINIMRQRGKYLLDVYCVHEIILE